MDNIDLHLIEELGIDLFAGESLVEFATVARFNKYNISLAVNPDSKRNFGNESYFKVYNDTSPNSADKIARIKFYTSEYVYHTTGGKKNWKLNSSDRKRLVMFLNSESTRDTGYSVWQSLIISFNYELGLDKPDTCNNFKNNLLYPNYLPIDLDIPDYESNIS